MPGQCAAGYGDRTLTKLEAASSASAKEADRARPSVSQLRRAAIFSRCETDSGTWRCRDFENILGGKFALTIIEAQVHGIDDRLFDFGADVAFGGG